MASGKLCKAHTVGIVLMATAVALVVQVERGDGLGDRGRGWYRHVVDVVFLGAAPGRELCIGHVALADSGE
jgi:hypothetical protein